MERREKEGLRLEHHGRPLGLTPGPRDWGGRAVIGRRCEGVLAPSCTHFTSYRRAVQG